MKFIDEAIIQVKAGHGGKGSVSFRREKFIPRGGPDGGNGGRGGDVIFKATHDMTTLMDFHYNKSFAAESGQNGMGKGMDGKAGVDLIVPVPVGTVLSDSDTHEILADFTFDGQTEIIAKAGRGGRGNAFFVSSTHQAPQYAQEGEPGEAHNVYLELKLLADVGLVGLPNAGKSTFLSVISRAKPKIANYPFTTLSPVLGVVTYKDVSPFVVADLPGLIEGAHKGKGMGDRFLKHTERTQLVLHLVSLSPDETVTPLKRYDLIEKELIAYNPAFKKRPRLVLLTKAELVDKKTIATALSRFKARKVPAFPISSVTRLNLDTVLAEVVKILKRRKVKPERS
jgi:GTP-binding protein